MSDDETQAFARALARDLAPVRRIPRLRVGLLRILGLWLAGSTAIVAMRGLAQALIHPDAMVGGFGAILFGSFLIAVGGIVAALASGVPGREATARTAAVVAAVGLIVSVVVGYVLLSLSPEAVAPMPGKESHLGTDLACLGIAGLVAFLPGVGALIYLGQTVPQRPWLSSAAVALGTFALGTVVAQGTCDATDLRHLMVAHALAPALGALVLGPLVFLVFRRLQGR